MKFLFTIFLILITLLAVYGQVISTTSNGRNNIKPAQAEQAETRILQVISDAGRYFKQGLLNLQDNRRPQAREDFDTSVEIFVMSGINLTANNNVKARDCYNQLIETVYRIEIPTDKQPPEIRALSTACNWNIENDLVDKITNLVQSLNPNPAKSEEEVSAEKTLAIAEKELAETKTELTEIAKQMSKRVFAENPANKSLDKTKELLEERLNSDEAYRKAKARFDKALNFYIRAYEKVLILLKDVKESPNSGFTAQKFKPSPLDDLTKLELSQEETDIISGNRSMNSGMRTVKAKSGDTVATLARREGANAVEVANFNGLSSINAPLAAGRVIKIPSGLLNPAKVEKQKYQIIPSLKQDIGLKPKQLANGTMPVVLDYFNENYNDPYSMRFIRWSKVEKTVYAGKTYWSVQVKFRSKNAFGAYILTEQIFYIQNNKVVEVKRIF